jgi:F-type H+-transporting ATPase subunit epsilon
MRFQILTPEKAAFAGEVISLSAPGDMGGFEILKNHAPILSSLAPGSVRVLTADKKEMHFHITGGFLEFSSNVGVVMADDVERPQDIDLDSVRKERAEVEALMRTGKSEESPARLQRRARIAASREDFRQRFRN